VERLLVVAPRVQSRSSPVSVAANKIANSVSQESRFYLRVNRVVTSLHRGISLVSSVLTLMLASSAMVRRGMFH